MIHLESALQAFPAFIYTAGGSWAVPSVSVLASSKGHIRVCSAETRSSGGDHLRRGSLISAQALGLKKEVLMGAG